MEFSRCEARISLDAIENNLHQMARMIRQDTQIMVVIKADGYGHGAIEIAKDTESLKYIWGFAVATTEEAASLRAGGITKPILILGRVFPEDFSFCISHDIRIPIMDTEGAKAFSDVAVSMKKDACIHIKLDTGMRRIGFLAAEESVKEIVDICRLPGLKAEGLFTHFFASDSKDKTSMHKQLQTFDHIKELLQNEGISFPIYHVSNSAAIIDAPEANKDVVRAGITTYGLWPSDEVDKTRIHLEPAMEVVARVAFVKEIMPKDTVGYGATYTAQEVKKIATVGFGYADGYPRKLSGRGWVLIHGQKAPIVGRVCMDQMMVDVTNLTEEVCVGDEVVLVGTSGDETITMEMLGDLSGRFNYEFACEISPRVPRVFLKKDKVISTRKF